MVLTPVSFIDFLFYYNKMWINPELINALRKNIILHNPNSRKNKKGRGRI